jgi:hypothetical protein
MDKKIKHLKISDASNICFNQRNELLNRIKLEEQIETVKSFSKM